MVKMFGISNCDSVKKAADWLKNNRIAFNFHDFSKEGINKDLVQKWMEVVGQEILINRKSKTWRELSEMEKLLAGNKLSAVELVLKRPTLIKRPLIDKGGEIIIGFDEDKFKNLFSKIQKLKK